MIHTAVVIVAVAVPHHIRLVRVQRVHVVVLAVDLRAVAGTHQVTGVERGASEELDRVSLGRRLV